ncbi:hypothetical protein [Streptomyces sp. NPDC058092]|uniref:hypothetical protein n=1 Tax=Streptomyces sp. NPDC058092 TaxID=3346336 RepID=UPI0036ED30A0
MTDSAPVGEVTAKRMWVTGGQTVSLTLQDRTYNTTPGWGSRGGQGIVGIAGAAKALVKLIESNGAH